LEAREEAFALAAARRRRRAAAGRRLAAAVIAVGEAGAQLGEEALALAAAAGVAAVTAVAAVIAAVGRARDHRCGRRGSRRGGALIPTPLHRPPASPRLSSFPKNGATAVLPRFVGPPRPRGSWLSRVLPSLRRSLAGIIGADFTRTPWPGRTFPLPPTLAKPW